MEAPSLASAVRSDMWRTREDDRLCWHDAELDPTLVIQPLLDEVNRYLAAKS